MSEKIIIGPINRGLTTNREPFVIDNDSFPVLINAYQWRGRVKRKRGTSLLGRLQRLIGVTNGVGNLTVTILPTPITSGISTFTIGTDIFVDPGGASPVTLITNGSGAGTLNRTTGLLTITGSKTTTNVIFIPSLPVMGLEDLILTVNQFPGTLAFDTRYSYRILTNSPYTIFDVSFYKNPPTGTPVTYTQKSTWTPTSWNGQDYQQFWTVNYQGALWATNGINIPFTTTNIGMQFASSSTTPALTAPTWVNPTTMTFTIAGNPLIVGDFVFANEFSGGSGLNYQTGYVTAAGNTFTVVFPNATIANAVYTPGMLQYLTNRSDPTLDGIRWYDGDPVDAAGNFITGKGWVNFAPPLSQSNYSIADLPATRYYLVGARMIVPFKDRLLFIGPVVQTSSPGSAKYLQDTVIYSQNGTPYYTASFTNSPSTIVDNPTSPTNNYFPILVPVNQTATPSAYFEDSTGFGGFVSAGIDQPANTCESNRDVLIIGFRTTQTKLVYSGNDISPFTFFQINSELGSSSTFSSVNMGDSVLSRGSRGYVSTDQTTCERFDVAIPDSVFEVRLSENGTERFTSQRDFINEWIYFTYPNNERTYKFPNQTLQFNYRDASWAIFNESYTTYGLFRKNTGYTWATIGQLFPTWRQWNQPWNAGSSTLLQPQVIGGNQQGFVLIRDEGTGEGNSLAIQNISGNTITSPNHSLNVNDFIVISGVSGTISSQVNGKVFKIISIGASSFVIDPVITGSPTYLGGGLIKRIYNPFIQTKQFPISWQMARKTKIGPQQYVLTTTSNSQISLLIYLSQNPDDPYNDGPIVPAPNTVNNSLIYSTVLYTCPESINLGLTPANTNLQMPGAEAQNQIWHRVNTSLIGDTVQLGFTMSDEQLFDPNFINAFSEIELHGIIIDVSPSSLLA